MAFRATLVMGIASCAAAGFHEKDGHRVTTITAWFMTSDAARSAAAFCLGGRVDGAAVAAGPLRADERRGFRVARHADQEGRR
jgi:hypothetical protein